MVKHKKNNNSMKNSMNKNKGCWCGNPPHFIATAGKWDCGPLATGFQNCTWNGKPMGSKLN